VDADITSEAAGIDSVGTVELFEGAQFLETGNVFGDPGGTTYLHGLV
jgi:hypothetical protein